MTRPLRSALLGITLVGCSASAPPPLVPARVHRIVPAAARQKSSPPAVPSLPTMLLAKVPSGTYGPYVGERPAGVVYVWASVRPDDPKHQRAWYTLPLQHGQLQGPPTRVADAPARIGLCAVEPSGGPNPYHDTKPNAIGAPGFVVLSTRVQNGFQQVEDFMINVLGQLRGRPTVLNVPSGEVLWVDAVATPHGTLALWAVRRETSADVYAAALGLDGEKLGDVHKVLSHARAWQAAPTENGAAVAAVVSSSGAHGTGSVKLVRIDESARAQPPISVSSSPTADLDLDMVADKGRLVLAWSDARAIEPRLYTASVDDQDNVTHGPAPATRAVGEQSLVTLVPPRDPAGTAYAAWENLAERPRGGGSVIEVARVGSDGVLGRARGAFSMAAGAGNTPEMKAAAQGLAALTLAPTCRASRTCDSAPELPTFVQFDSSFHVTDSEPMRLDALGGKGASLAWGLTCRQKVCTVLAAPATSPAPVYVVDASHRTVNWTAPAWRVVPPPPPRAESNQAIAAIDSVSDLAARRVGGGVLAAWVSHFDPATPDVRLKRPAPDGRFDPLRAKLQTRAVMPDGSLSNLSTISLRARSPGGVALAPGKPAHPDALLAWAALDHQVPEVFVTLLDPRGHKLTQRMLTHGKHDVSDVAAAYVGDGWLVAWIDRTHGKPEVYVTKVNRRLTRVAPERRITSTTDVKSELAVIAHDKIAQLVWAEGTGLYEERVNGKDAKPLAAAKRVAPSSAPIQSLALAAYGRGTVAAWVSARGGAGANVHLGLLDPDGRLVGTPAGIRAAGGAADAVAVSCPDDRCRVVISVTSGELQGFEWSPNLKQAQPVRLVNLLGPTDEATHPALLGRDLLFADQAHHGTRVRHVRVQWQ